mmetsp:Transcript_14507/g.24774  ORF Transcript_14507/g.24774 Transcript_14507/m.24774 type:complete len:311 (+) Transcript_14507:115-1047(+)
MRGAYLYSGLRDNGDDMGGWHLKLFIDLGSQVLIQQGLELLILLLHLHRGVDGLAATLQQIVVTLQEQIEGFPDAEVHVGDHVAHAFPELAFLAASARLAIRLALGAQLLRARLLLLVRRHVGDAGVLLLLDEVLQMLQHVIWLHHQRLVIFLLTVVEDLHQEIHVLLTLHSDVAEQGIDLQHIALLQGKFGQLIADLHIQQKLSLVFDQIQDLLHLGCRELAGVGLAHVRGLQGGALPGGGAALGKGVQLLLQQLLLGRYPLVAQLLFMQEPICLQHFGHQAPYLGFVHLPDLPELLLVRLLEVLELLL